MSRFDAAALDARSTDELRRIGALKWSQPPDRPDRIGAFVAETDFGTAPEVTAALHAAVDGEALGYLTPPRQRALAEATAGWYADRYGWALPPAWVRPVPDVMTGLLSVMRHVMAPEGRVVLPTPAYMPFLLAPAAHGRAVVEVPMAEEDDRWVYDLDALAAALRPGDLLIVCNPHNPVGRVLAPDELTAIAEVVDRAGARVFADEIHAPLVYAGHRHTPYAALSETAAGHATTATSASKAWNLAGLLCAQLVLSNDADARLWSGLGPWEETASSLGAVAATAAYTAGGEWLDGQLAYLDGSRRLLGELLADQLPEVGYRMPEGTYLTLLDVRPLGLGDEPAAYLAEHAGVELTEGRRCGRVATGYVRYNLATPRPVIRETVRRLAAAVA